MATTTETLIYEIQINDGGASKKFSAWDKRLKESEGNFKAWQKTAKQAKSGLEDFASQVGGLTGAFLKVTLAGEKLYHWVKDLDFGLLALKATVFAVKTTWHIFLAGLKLGITVVKNIGMAIVAVSKQFVNFAINAGKNFAQFEDTLGHARRTMNLTRGETQELGDALIDLSVNFEDAGLKGGVASNELAKISGVLGQLGFDARENQEAFTSLVATVAKVSLAFGMSSTKAAEMLGILQNLYNVPTDQLSNVASSVAALGNSTVATADQILNIMTRIGGIAGLLGVSAQEAAGLAATLREAGVSAQVGGTALSQVFSRMSGDLDKFTEVLGKGGLNAEMMRFQIESGNSTEALKGVLQAIQNINATEGKIAAIQALKDLGLQGVRVQQTLLGLSNNIGNLNKNLALSDQAFRENIAVNEAYEKSIDNTKQQWKALNTILDSIIKFIGKDLSNSFSSFLENHLMPFTKHFQEWIKTSATSKKIFGPDGYIARGLEILGNQLTDSEGDFFRWLDNIDKHAGTLLENLLTGFNAWYDTTRGGWEEFKDTAMTALDVLNDFLDWIPEAKRGWDDFTNTITFFAEEVNASFQRFFEPLADFIAWFDDVKHNIDTTRESWVLMDAATLRVLGDVGQALKSVGGTIKDYLVAPITLATKAMEKLGVIAVYQSVIPDIEDATIKLTKSTLQYNDGIETTTDSTKNLYTTGNNVWTNINREINLADENTNAWFKSNTQVKKSVDDVEFALYQTGKSVSNLSGLYGEVAEEAGKAGQVIVATAQEAIKLNNLAEQFVANATAGNAASMAAIAAGGGASNESIREMMKTPGIMDAKGLRESSEILRRNQEPLIPQALPPVPAQPTKAADPVQHTGENFGTIPQVLQATLVMSDQEVGHFSAVLSDREQQDTRRQPGGRF